MIDLVQTLNIRLYHIYNMDYHFHMHRNFRIILEQEANYNSI